VDTEEGERWRESDTRIMAHTSTKTEVMVRSVLVLKLVAAICSP
jgi:hypothetical protein